MEWYEGPDKQESVFLTDKQIEDKAVTKYPKKKHTFSDIYVDEEDIRERQRSTYINTWKECTQHYKELIEAGVIWGEFADYCDKMKSLYNMETMTQEEVGIVLLNMLNKITELNNRK